MTRDASTVTSRARRLVALAAALPLLLAACASAPRTSDGYIALQSQHFT
jgi:starvation-inducible outer membrane lipoprotein